MSIVLGSRGSVMTLEQRTCRVVVIGSDLAEVASDVEGVEVVDSWEDWQGANAILAGGPEMVLLDIEAKGAARALRELRNQNGTVPVIVVVPHEEVPLLIEAAESGASGLVPKPAEQDVIRGAIEVIRAGGSYLHPREAKRMVEAITSRRSAAPLDVHLTKRETEVLRLLSKGHPARQMAEELGLSERTINTHVANLYRKLGVSNRVEALRAALKLEIIESP